MRRSAEVGNMKSKLAMHKRKEDLWGSLFKAMSWVKRRIDSLFQSRNKIQWTKKG